VLPFLEEIYIETNARNPSLVTFGSSPVALVGQAIVTSSSLAALT